MWKREEAVEDGRHAAHRSALYQAHWHGLSSQSRAYTSSTPSNVMSCVSPLLNSTTASTPVHAPAITPTHLLLTARLVPLLLLLGVAEHGKRRRHLAGLDSGQGLAEVLCDLLDERGEKGVGLVLLDEGSHNVGREGGEVGLGLGVRGDGSLERVTWGQLPGRTSELQARAQSSRRQTTLRGSGRAVQPGDGAEGHAPQHQVLLIAAATTSRPGVSGFHSLPSFFPISHLAYRRSSVRTPLPSPSGD